MLWGDVGQNQGAMGRFGALWGRAGRCCGVEWGRMGYRGIVGGQNWGAVGATWGTIGDAVGL